MKKLLYFTFYIAIAFLFNSIVACDDDTAKPEPTKETDDTTSTDSANFIWKNWYLSVPIDRGDGSGKATSIYYESIVNDNLNDEQKKYFYQNENSSYTLYTKFTGYTTSGEVSLDGSGYCRTELREFWQGNQTTDDNWFMSAGTKHILESTIKVEFCEGNGKTYVAQIHGKTSPTTGSSNSPATVKVLWDNNDLKIEYYLKPESGIWTSDDIEKITIGTVNNDIFTIRLKVENGKLYYALYCEESGINDDYQYLYDYLSSGYDHDNYFKTGNYFKYNDDYTQASQVILYKVKTEHY